MLFTRNNGTCHVAVFVWHVCPWWMCVHMSVFSVNSLHLPVWPPHLAACSTCTHACLPVPQTYITARLACCCWLLLNYTDLEACVLFTYHTLLVGEVWSYWPPRLVARRPRTFSAEMEIPCLWVWSTNQLMQSPLACEHPNTERNSYLWPSALYLSASVWPIKCTSVCQYLTALCHLASVCPSPALNLDIPHPYP